MDRKTFRSARFGSWATAQAMDARAVEAGKKVGADFRYDRQTRTPNTLAGHALARLARVEGGAALQAEVIEALFAAYFTDGEDVGDLAVLGRIADAAGMGADAVARSASLKEEVLRHETAARASGLSSVPSYMVDGAIPKEDRPPEWTEATDGAVETITSGPERLAYMAPGPFDPFEDDWGGMIELAGDASDEMLARMSAKEDPQRTVSDIYNLVLAFDLEAKRRDAFAQQLPEFLSSLPDQSFTVAVDFALQLAARWRATELSERLIDLSLVRAGSGGLKNLSAGPSFSLLAAASHADQAVWSRKVGEYMNGFAFPLPPGPAITNMIAAIELIGGFSPALQPSLTSAKSFAVLAYNHLGSEASSGAD
jgi:hypothetical protein